MKTILLHYLLLLPLLLLCSCEVALHDNFVPVEPLPQELPIQIVLNAAQNSNGELILVGGLEVDYDISTPENQLVHAVFYVNDREIYQTSRPEGKFQYTGSDTEKSQLRCVITLKRLKGGESILDQLTKDQLFQGELSWPVHNLTPILTFYQKPEEVSLESITVRWSFNVPGYYFNVYHNEELIASKISAQSITFPTPIFGSYNYIKVRIVDEQGKETFPYEPKLYEYTGIATNLGKGMQLRSIYSPYSNTLYTSNYNEVTSHSVPSLTPIYEFKDNGTNANPVAVVLNSDKLAVDYSYSYLRIFSRHDLKSSVKINYPEYGNAPQSIVLTSDNKLTLYYAYLSKIYVYNADNGQLENTVSLPEVGNNPEQVLAPWYNKMNEQYLFQPLATGGFYLTSLQGLKADRTVFYPHKYSDQASFHPTRLNEILFENNDRIETVDCRSGQTIRIIMKDSGWSFCNIDPVTENYLFQTNREAIIISKEGIELFRVKSVTSQLYLANNILICRDGYALNVEPYLKK